MRVEWENISKSAREAADDLNGSEWVKATFKARALLFDLADEHDRLAAEAGRLREQRDTFLAFAAAELVEFVSREDGSDFTPEEAVAMVAKIAGLNIVEAGEAGWGAGEYATLANCRDAVVIWAASNSFSSDTRYKLNV